MTTFLKIIVICVLFVSPLFVANLVRAYGEPAAAPVCSNTVPGTPTIKTLTTSTDSVTLSWDGVSNATSWTVAYGVETGKYIYGVHNFGTSGSTGLTINSLPGNKYYFALRANNDCMPGAFSGEKSVTFSGGTGSSPVTYETTSSGEDEEVATTPAPKKTTVTPAPKKVSPTPIPQKGQQGGTGQSPALSIWQRILNFFRGLFGGR